MLSNMVNVSLDFARNCGFHPEMFDKGYRMGSHFRWMHPLIGFGLFIVFVVVVIVLFVKHAKKKKQAQKQSSPAIELLKISFAKGEITQEEYEARMKVLKE